MLKDKDIRFKFILENKDLFKKGIFINEYDINGKNRVDFALLYENNFYGYEIKSEADNTSRLINQLKTYLKFFDYTYLIIHEKHKEEVYDILNKYKLNRIGIICVDNFVNFKKEKEAKGLDKKIRLHSLIRNLKKEDLQDLIKEKNLKCSYNFKEGLLSALIGKINIEEVLTKLENRLKISYVKKCPSCKSNLIHRTKVHEVKEIEDRVINKDKRSYKIISYEITTSKTVDKCMECNKNFNENSNKVVSKTIKYSREFKL